MNWIVIFFIISSCCLFYLYYQEKNKNIEIEKINEEKRKENEKIDSENQQLLLKKEAIEQQCKIKEHELNQAQKHINNMQEVSQHAFEKYNDILDEAYQSKEKGYDTAIQLLEESYNKKQDNIIAEIDKVSADLDKISATRAAAIQAQLKEEEIQQKQEFYSLSLDEIDKREIKILQSIESELRDPRPVRMIIWQTYYSKKANELSARVLGSADICGIYKITNKNNAMCYIGQAKNVRERFREHMKCGLGIDTPANNKLYQAMKKEGIDTFTFELLEACNSVDLNEKEKFYIDLYDSYHFGYNSNTGIKKV